MRKEDKINRQIERKRIVEEQEKKLAEEQEKKLAEEQEKKLAEEQETSRLIESVKQNDKTGYLIYKELELIVRQNDIIINLLQHANYIKSKGIISNEVSRSYDANDYLRDSLIVDKVGRRTVEGEAAYRRMRDYEKR